MAVERTFPSLHAAPTEPLEPQVSASEASPVRATGAFAQLVSQRYPGRAAAVRPPKAAPTRVPRLFEYAKHDSVDNHAAWTALLDATEQEDAMALREALHHTIGAIEPVGPSGGVRRGALSKRVLALMENHVEFTLFAFRFHRLARSAHYPQSVWQGTGVKAQHLAWLAHPGLFAESLALDLSATPALAFQSTVMQRVVSTSQGPLGDTHSIKHWLLPASTFRGHYSHESVFSELFQDRPTLTANDAAASLLATQQRQTQILEHSRTDDNLVEQNWDLNLECAPVHRRPGRVSILSAFYAELASHKAQPPHCDEEDFIQARERVCAITLLDALCQVGKARLGDGFTHENAKSIEFDRESQPFVFARDILKLVNIFTQEPIPVRKDKAGDPLLFSAAASPGTRDNLHHRRLSGPGTRLIEALCGEIEEWAQREQWDCQAWSQNIRKVLLGAEQLDLGGQAFSRIAALFWAHQPHALLPLHRDDSVRVSSLFQSTEPEASILTNERMGQWIAHAPGQARRPPSVSGRLNFVWQAQSDDARFWTGGDEVFLPTKAPDADLQWSLIDWAPLYARPGIAMVAVREGVRLSPFLMKTALPPEPPALSGPAAPSNGNGNASVSSAVQLIARQWSSLRRHLERIELEQEMLDRATPGTPATRPRRRL